MNLNELREAVQIDLDDVDAEIWETDSLDRAIQRAVWDLSRIIPLEKLYSTKIEWDIEDESFTSSFDAAVALSDNPIIQPKSETVKNDPDDDTEFTRDTDYTMDYAAGTITVLSTGSMLDTTGYLIDYNKNKVALDISALTDLIRVSMVEYPSGKYPEEMASFNSWGDFLYITSAGMKSQAALTEDEYAFIFYKAYHTIPTETEDGSFPTFLDEVVIKGSAAYALLIRALDLQHKSSDNVDASIAALVLAQAVHTSITAELVNVDGMLATADTALDKVASEVAKGATALDKVQTYGAGASGAYDAVASLVSSALSALSGAATQITSVGTDLTSADVVWSSLDDFIIGGTGIKGAQPLLEDGIPLINVVNLGSNVAELLARYSEAEVSIAGIWGDKAQRYLVSAQARVAAAQARTYEASQYIASAQSRISEGDGRVAIANAFVAEASQRLNSAVVYTNEAVQRLVSAGIYLQKAIRLSERINAYMAEADRYLVVATRDMELSVASRNRGLEWRAEFWEVLKDRAQYLKKRSEVSRRQYK